MPKGGRSGGFGGGRSHGGFGRSHGHSFGHHGHHGFGHHGIGHHHSSFGNSGFHHRHHYGGGSGNAIILDPNWDLKTSPNGEFESGLCNCCENCSDFCVAWCFPCILDCTIANAVEKNGCCGCIACMCPIAMCCIRTKLREKKKINGSVLGDLAVTLFCHLCAAVQMKKEIELRIDPNQVAPVVQINQPMPNQPMPNQMQPNQYNQFGAYDSQAQQNMNNQIPPNPYYTQTNQTDPTAIPPPPSYY